MRRNLSSDWSSSVCYSNVFYKGIKLIRVCIESIGGQMSRSADCFPTDCVQFANVCKCACKYLSEDVDDNVEDDFVCNENVLLLLRGRRPNNFYHKKIKL